jgi:hypothetical protein
MRMDNQDWYELKAIAGFVLALPLIWAFWIVIMAALLGFVV